MKKVLIKKCQKQVVGKQREKNMLIIGRELFSERTPKKDIPMYRVSKGTIIK